MAASYQHPVYEFGGFHLDTGQRLLFRADGKRAPLTSRTFDTLVFMIEHPGELLDTDTLMEAIWPNITVEENNLQQCISALRRALGEKPDDHRFIVTSRGRGYRFVAPVRIASPRPAWRRPVMWGGGILAAGVLAALLAALPHVGYLAAEGDAPSATVTVPVPSIPVSSPNGPRRNDGRI